MPRSLSEPIDQEILDVAGSMERPIPGQSLTNDPENPAPFEKPPKFTNLKKAQMEIASKLMEEEVYETVMESVEAGVPIMDITSNILYAGFRGGQWNPDLMLLLAEPTAYTIMALAERAGIEYKIDSEVEPEDENSFRSTVAQKTPESTEIPQGAIPKEVTEIIDEAPSLLEKPSDKESA